MDKVTLNHQQFCGFVNWSEKHALKQVATDRVKKLEKMGMQSVTMDGKGKKATFTFMIPSGFWRMQLAPHMDYSEVAVDYINTLIEGRDVLNTPDGILVLFATEIYEALAKKHNMNPLTVKTTCTRLRAHLMEHDYIREGSMRDAKSHRVKRKLEWGWQKGPNAIQYDIKARKVWKDFFDGHDAAYRRLNPRAEKAPVWVYAQEAKELYQSTMARLYLDVAYYRVAKRTIINDNLVADINFIRMMFLDTLDMGLIRRDMLERQADYKAVKERQMKMAKEHMAEKMPTKEERRAIQAKLMEIRRSENFQRRNWTQKKKDDHDKLMDVIIGMVETTEGHDID